jgi:hypothetical protein
MIVHPQVGDIGFEVILIITREGVALDVAPASSLQMLFRAPDGRSKTFTALLKTDGTDGKVYYRTAAASDLDMAGIWETQVKLTLGSFTGYTSRAFMPVKDNANR